MNINKISSNDGNHMGILIFILFFFIEEMVSLCKTRSILLFGEIK